MVNPDEDILQQFVQEEPSESPLTLLAGNTATANDAPSGSLNAYRASGASVQPAKSAAEIYNQLHPEAATRIQRFFELADERGLGLKPGSMNRDYGTQAKMYANRASNPYPVAPPGGSAHMGFATDFSGYKPEKLQAIRELAKEVGLVYGGNWNGKSFDPVHIQLGPGNEVTRYIQGHIDPKAGSVNWEGVRTTALPEDFLKRAIAAAQGQNVPVKEVKVEGASNATGSVTAAAEPSVEEADAKVEVTKKRKDIDFAKLIKMLDDSTHGGADYLSRSMQANAQQAQANRSRSLAQIAQFDQEQVNKMAEALKGGRTQSFKEGGEVEGEDTPNLDKLMSDLMKERTTEAEILDNGFKPRDYDPAKITQALSIMSGSKDPSTQLQMQYMLGKLGLNAGVLQSDKYRGYNAGVNIPLSDTSSVNLGGNYGRVMGAYGQESPAKWGVRGSYVKRFAEGGPKLPDRPEYEMTDNSNAVDATPNTSLEQLFQALTGGRNLQNDLSNIKSRLPTGQDYGHALLEQRDSTQAMNEQSRQNLREGYANRDLPQMLLGTGQGAMGLISPAMAPINAGFEVLSKTAGKFDPRAKVEAELLGLVGTEGAGVTQKLHNLELPKSSWDALLKKYQDSGATQAMTIGLPAAVAAAERPAEAVTRSLSPIGLYSHAAEMAEALPQAKGTPEQMRAMLFDKYGVKPAELEGFEEKFFGRPSVTKEELATHFRERMPKVEEKVLGKTVSEPYPEELDKIEQQIQAKHGPKIEEALAKYRDGSLSPEERNVVYNDLRKLQKNYEKELYEAVPNRDELRRKASGIITPAKFEKWSLPGGENYREVLLKLPSDAKAPTFEKWYEKTHIKPLESYADDPRMMEIFRNKYDAEVKNMPKEVSFKSTHWDDPNVLAHLRMSDRTGPKGEKLLHVEEMQSDWGQQGREKGFKGEVERQIPTALQAVRQAERNVADTFDRLIASGLTEQQAHIHPEFNAVYDQSQAAKKAYGDLNLRSKSGIPKAPYVTSTQGWTDLALKRVMKEAAEGGYDGIVFTPGAEQAKRYDLSKSISNVEYDPNSKTLQAIDHNRNVVLFERNVEPNKLPDFLGKEVAEKLMNEKNIVPYSDGTGIIAHELSGQDLSIGGEGMKGYYDKIVPTQLQKMVKGYDKDAKLGTMRTNSLPDMLHMPVTDKMREHILKGQKAYMRGGRVGYADGGLVADNADGTGRQQYDAYGNVSDSQGGPVHAVQYDPDRINMMAQQLHEGTYG